MTAVAAFFRHAFSPRVLLILLSVWAAIQSLRGTHTVLKYHHHHHFDELVGMNTKLMIELVSSTDYVDQSRRVLMSSTTKSQRVGREMPVSEPATFFKSKTATTKTETTIEQQRKLNSSETSDRNINGSVPEDFFDFKEFFSSLSSSSSPPWAVFYNVFVPPDPINSTSTLDPYSSSSSKPTPEQARKIIREQLGQISKSYAAQAYSNLTLHVFYNSIGSPLDPAWMKRVCAGNRAQKRNSYNGALKCHNIRHYPHDMNIFEEVTLQRAWDYCHAFPQHKIIYLHSKGSYNSRGGRNHFWRRHMTHAVTHQQCLERVFSSSMADSSCDMCGLVFNPLPWIHYSGNFFTAECRYIRKLLPLPTYRKQMALLAHQITRPYANASRLLFQLFPDKDAYLGLERYASEHWPGSHPSLRACDLSKIREINFWKTERAPSTEPGQVLDTSAMQQWLKWSRAPRETEASGLDLVPKSYRDDISQRMREYYFLAGHTLKWTFLYNDLPSPDSWVWKFYPDGERWKSEYYGEDADNVIMKLLNPYAIASAAHNSTPGATKLQGGIPIQLRPRHDQKIRLQILQRREQQRLASKS